MVLGMVFSKEVETVRCIDPVSSVPGLEGLGGMAVQLRVGVSRGRGSILEKRSADRGRLD